MVVIQLAELQINTCLSLSLSLYLSISLSLSKSQWNDSHLLIDSVAALPKTST